MLRRGDALPEQHEQLPSASRRGVHHPILLGMYGNGAAAGGGAGLIGRFITFCPLDALLVLTG